MGNGYLTHTFLTLLFTVRVSLPLPHHLANALTDTTADEDH